MSWSSTNAEYFYLWECPKIPKSEKSSQLSGPRKKKRKKMTEVEKSQIFAKEVGRLRLQKDKMQSSLPATISVWKLGLPNFVRMDGSPEINMMRQITQARALERDRQTVKAVNFEMTTGSQRRVPISANHDKVWFRTVMESGRGGAKQQCSFLEKFIIIKDPNVNTRHFFTPNPHLPGLPFHLQYSIVDLDSSLHKWRDFSVWYVNPQLQKTEMSAGGTLQVMKLSNTLFVLESTKLVLYDFNTGRKLQEFDLKFDTRHPRFHYSSLNIDTEGDRIYVSANHSNVRQENSEMNFELLVLAYPPLTLLHRILIPKTGPFSGVKDVEILGGLGVLCKSSGVDLVDFNKLLRLNTTEDDKHGKTVVLKKSSETLTSLATMTNYLMFVPHAWPPHVFTKKANVYELRSLEMENNGKNYHRVLQFVRIPTKSEEGDVILAHFNDDERPIIVTSGLAHGFDIIHLDCKAHKSSVVFSTKDFHKTDLPQMLNGDTTNMSSIIDIDDEEVSQRRRQGLRRIVRQTYRETENEPVYGCAFDGDLNMFAVCKVDKGILYVTILDNKIVPGGGEHTLKKLKELQPVTLSLPPRFGEIGCSEAIVHFHEWFISVELKLFDNLNPSNISHEIYTVKVCGEVTTR